jgi:GNAT superfamily N-acetyltransferase
MVIRSASPEEIPAVMALARESFMAAVAPHYSAEGVRTFLDYASADAMGKRIEEGHRAFVAYEGGELVGMALIRGGSHLAMLFVAPHRQRRGIGRRLFETVLGAVSGNVVTVNSSPNSEGAYLKLGFTRTGGEAERNGIRFIPMEWRRVEEGVENGMIPM